MSRPSSRLPLLETVLWVAASIIAFVAFIVLAPGFFGGTTSTTKSSTSANLIEQDVARPTLTPLPLATPVPPFAPAPKVNPPQPLPQPSGREALFTLSPDPAQSGWVRSSESQPHWGERPMNAGAFKGQNYEGLLYFDLSSLAPGIKLSYADVELQGMDRSKLGPTGTWTISLLKPQINVGWQQHSSGDFVKADTFGVIGKTLAPEDLAVGATNQFVFSKDQLTLLEQLINGKGIVTFRIDGPTGARDSLFTWDAGGLENRSGSVPVIHLVGIPGQFVSVTNTPTPQNVITAAAQAQTLTAHAARFGTATPYPRNYATATPFVAITPQPTPANRETVAAEIALATAVARTTGTYTPTPPNWATVYPTATPLYISLATLTPFATATPIPGPLQAIETPMPPDARGNILFLSDHFGAKLPLMMRPDGMLLQALSGTDLYDAAHARDMFSPDRSKLLVLLNDSGNQLQVWIQDVRSGGLTQVSKIPNGKNGLAYDPAWSPDGSKIAYVDSEWGPAEIVIYDVNTHANTRMTYSPAGVYNQRPSWSPDSQQLVYKSNRDTGHFQIWMMNRDGSGVHNVSNNAYNDVDPVWVK
jgi:hypothetical protein